MSLRYLALSAGLGLAMVAAPASAAIVLTFEGVGNNAGVQGFYNGGTDSLGNSGPNLGVEFNANALGLVDADSGGGGNFANEPTPNTILFFLSGTAILNYAAGFDTGFSFFYTSSTAATVNVYDGLNATGNLLGSINLVAQFTDNCVGDPTGGFCNWTPAGVAFAGTAKSIDFGGTVNQTGYDNITFGSERPGTGNPVPEPATWALMIGGFGMAGAVIRRRRSLSLA